MEYRATLLPTKDGQKCSLCPFLHVEKAKDCMAYFQREFHGRCEDNAVVFRANITE